jgi:hypothetical protein
MMVYITAGEYIWNPLGLFCFIVLPNVYFEELTPKHIQEPTIVALEHRSKWITITLILFEAIIYFCVILYPEQIQRLFEAELSNAPPFNYFVFIISLLMLVGGIIIARLNTRGMIVLDPFRKAILGQLVLLFASFLSIWQYFNSSSMLMMHIFFPASIMVIIFLEIEAIRKSASSL